jgi:UDP-N-acetylglucosamine 2-epimerase
LHPIASSGSTEEKNADALLTAIQQAGIEQTVVIYPNNDPGSHNIIRVWQRRRREMTYLLRDVPRDIFLGLMRDAAVMIGNSSAGIIEAASFGTPVIDVGPRQKGRLRSQNVTNVPYGEEAIRRAVARVWNNGRPRRFTGRNVYGGEGAGRRIASILAELALDEARLRRKLIAY